MTDTNLPTVGTNQPIVGKQYVHKEAGDITVNDVKKRGRGYYVLFRDMDGVERRARLKDFRKATA